ncbi:MAG TPA: glutamate formimidoyltransferase, partial [Chitinophagaceae bacterium]|nr:glutamate formimidoyltransferase [Chitinophagaceae bacterium]
MEKILECIPNFSEGADSAVIEKIALAIQSVSGVWLLHTDQSPAANRTVITFAGTPEAVVEAAFRAIKKAAELIDMSRQEGVHPRIGATDVCPLVPLQGMSMEEADAYAQQLGRRVGQELNIPVFLYEYSQALPYRKSLPQIRKGQYEGLAAKMQLPEWAPDFGPREMNRSAGATVLGARRILVAFNISLDTTDVQVAETIAQQMRTVSRSESALPRLRAIGWYMADYGQAQVSFNLLDFRETSPLQVWQRCAALAKALGVTLTGSEVIGLIPEACLLEAGDLALKEGDAAAGKDRISAAIAYMGLDQLKPFAPEEKILEYALQKHSDIR